MKRSKNTLHTVYIPYICSKHIYNIYVLYKHMHTHTHTSTWQYGPHVSSHLMFMLVYVLQSYLPMCGYQPILTTYEQISLTKVSMV